MSLGTSNRDGGKTSESGHLRALAKIVSGDIITGLNVVQRAAGVNMSVDIQVGDAFVRRSDGTYAHPVFNDAVYNQVISAADGSNPRRDIVVIYVDYGQAPSTAVSNNTNGVVKIKVVNGTPAGSPVDPDGAAIQASVGAGNPYSILARVRVPAGQTSISNSLIDDLRTMISNNASTVDKASIKKASVDNTKVDFSTEGKIWWEEIGRTKLVATSNTISIPSIAARKYLKLMIAILPTGGTVDNGLRFNNDSGTNYNYRRQANGGAENGAGSTNYAYIDASVLSSTPFFIDCEVLNIANQEKLLFATVTGGAAAGAATTPNRVHYANKWSNTSTQITRVDLFNTSGTGGFGAGSEVIILGHD